jgi:hypothetical protein
MVATAPDGPAAFACIMAHPALLWDRRWPEIDAWIAGQPQSDRDSFRGHLRAISRLAGNLAGAPWEWPDGVGPIHDLARKVIDGEWSLSRGLAEAAGPEVSGALAPLYVQVVAERTRVRSVNGDWLAAVTTFRLLLAAVDAVPESAGAVVMRRHALVNWIETAGAACGAVPDGRLFTDVLRRAESYLVGETDPIAAADAMHRLGVLHLDPWISGRSSRNYANELRIWRQRLADTYGPSVAADPAAALPEPVAALTTGIGWFRRALSHRSGEARGRTLKALAEALVWREIAGGEADHAAVRACATEALSLLPPGANDTAIQVLHGLLRFAAEIADVDAAKDIAATDRASPETAGGQGRVGEEPSQDEASPDLLWLEPEDVMRRLGETQGRERYLWQARSAVDNDPHQAIGLILRLWPILTRPADEAVKRSLIGVFAEALVNIPGVEPIRRDADGDSARFRPLLVAAAKAGVWARGRQVAVMAGLAFSLTADAREDEALTLLAQALEVAPEAAPALVDPLRILQADLMLGAAVNALNAQQWDKAIEGYVGLIAPYVRLGLTETAMETLVRAEDVTFRDQGRIPTVFAIGLAAHAAELAAIGPPRIGDRLQQSWMRVMARICAQQPVNARLLWLVLQAAKGAAFAAMLQRADYDWRRDPEATALLSRIAELRGAGSPPVAAGRDTLDDDLMLVAYAGDSAADAAQDDPLANLECRFDAHVARRLTDGRGALESLLIGDDLPAALGPRTVLLSHYAGRTEDARLSLTTVLQTSDDIAIACGVGTMPSGVAVMRKHGRTAEMNLWGPTVAALRHAVTGDPGPADVLPEGGEQLASDYARLLGGGLADRLAGFRAGGRDHLCIHPHGPYHFYPLHLLGPEGVTLADDWIVTTLPHPSLLRRRASEPAERTHQIPVVALGLDFAGGQPHGLPPLLGAADEARSVAAILHGLCWVNAEATEARFLEAITGATRVHVATHGQHDVSAPLFQRLFLSPDSASDGVFHAYEALGLDLRHVDLLTLSACETALGRCDINDTLRGLPAALFTAGVATIISTLWPVDDRPARLFFETLYGCLGQGAAKLDAFAVAQRTVRRAWPAYRDWGAFQYSGLW